MSLIVREDGYGIRVERDYDHRGVSLSALDAVPLLESFEDMPRSGVVVRLEAELEEAQNELKEQEKITADLESENERLEEELLLVRAELSKTKTALAALKTGSSGAP